MKKKWSDLKLATKKRTAALKRSQNQTGGGEPAPDLNLTPPEERVAGLIGSESIEGVMDDGDTDIIEEPQQGQF